MAKKLVTKKAAPKKTTSAKAKPQAKAKAKPVIKSKAVATKGKPNKKAAPKPAATPAEPLVGGPVPTPATQPLKPPRTPKSKSPASAPDMAHAQPKLDKSSAHQRNLKAATMKGRIAKSAAGPNIAGHISARGRRQQARRDSKN